ncbi:olfactory receptor 1012-like protein [Camelus ferus]|nr:olfactory receptor 1012-like protein [Camelus ferus]
MERSNHTVTEFILVGFTTDPVMQLVLFVMFLGVYSVTLVGNTTLTVLICNDSRLYTPMYFFIGNLSLLDLWYSSVYTPKILMTCISEDKSISFPGCAAQFFSAGLRYSECYLLAAMAYDHYVAISNHLLYAQAMPSNTLNLSFCGDNVVDDFFCDVPLLVKLACDVEETYQDVLYFLLASNVITPALLILASCLFIIAAIPRIRSPQGRFKTFSTCSSDWPLSPCTVAPLSTSTLTQLVPREGQIGAHILHCAVPHAEPHALQSEE